MTCSLMIFQHFVPMYTSSTSVKKVDIRGLSVIFTLVILVGLEWYDIMVLIGTSLKTSGFVIF